MIDQKNIIAYLQALLSGYDKYPFYRTNYYAIGGVLYVMGVVSFKKYKTELIQKDCKTLGLFFYIIPVIKKCKVYETYESYVIRKCREFIEKYKDGFE